MSHLTEIVSITFRELMNECRVRIPMIQREYAQGRDDDEGNELRKNFVPYLMRAFLCPINLDFIYGELKEENNTKLFIPLDGQQRLTTLLLLHWVAGEETTKNWTFDFETRRTAQQFVKHLLETTPPNLQDLLANQKTPKYLSNALTGKPWFFASWLSDPTVSGMLTMLDALVAEIPNDTDITLCDISFHCKFIDEIVSDKVYLKMNARGKPLTSWENLKALLDGKTSDDEWKTKIDTVWENQFWKMLSEEDKNKPSEAVLSTHFWLSSILHFSMCEYLIKQQSVELEKKSKEEREEDITQFHNHTAPLSLFDEYLSRSDRNDARNDDPQRIKDLVKYATVYFNALSTENMQIIKSCWSNDRANNELWTGTRTDNDKFLQVTKNNVWSYKDHVRLYVLTRNMENVTDADRKKRALLNLLDFSSVEASTLANCLKSVDEIFATGTPNFEKASGFDTLQRQEEAVKWQLDAEGVCKLECDYPLFKGSIGFLSLKTDMQVDELRTRMKNFYKTFVNEENKNFKGQEAFVEILRYMKELPNMIHVPKENPADWINLLRYDQIRSSLAHYFNNEIPQSPPWVTFYANVCNENNNVYLKKIDSKAYLLNSSQYRANSIRLSYNLIGLTNLNRTKQKFCWRDDSYLELKDQPQKYYNVNELEKENPVCYAKDDQGMYKVCVE